MIGPSHPARDDVLGAISLLDAAIASDGVQGADALALIIARKRLIAANDKLRPQPPSAVTCSEPVVQKRHLVGLSGVKSW